MISLQLPFLELEPCPQLACEGPPLALKNTRSPVPITTLRSALHPDGIEDTGRLARKEAGSSHCKDTWAKVEAGQTPRRQAEVKKRQVRV